MISKKLRVRCGKCVEVCPLGLIVQAAPELPPSKCIACGICAEDCPMEIPEVAESGSFSSVKQRPRAKSAGTLSHIREDCL
jgi:MinD superfamily P-loop ATPase